MIVAKNYIETGFSSDDAEKLDKVLQPLMSTDERIIIDFSDVKMFTTLFFNIVLGKYLVEHGPKIYEQRVEVKNLSEVGQVTYQHSIDNAKEYYGMSTKERKNQEELLSDIE